jgi:phenylpropionate dioxygenase-like ring-hydroxylating dioxygenase large terminal subunit
MFMQNAWYAAAWDREVGRTPLARRICDKPLVLYRRADGAPVALEDMCCHRMLPLSHGKLDGDRLVCGYHGLTFDSTGACVAVPSQDTVPPAARVRAYPLVERHRFVWVWIGDAALADPDLVPDLHWNDDPAWAGDGELIHADCDYRLLIDNLLDLTHETYVHASSIGDARLPSSPVVFSGEGDGATVSRWIFDHPPAPFYRNILARRGYTGNCDRWQIVSFVAPCNVVVDAGVAEVGSGAERGDRSTAIDTRIINCLTPSAPGKCLYFWSHVRSFAIDDEQLTRTLVAAGAKIFAEDKIVVEAQQRRMDEFPDNKMLNINLDVASVRVRRMIEAGAAGVKRSTAA